MKHLIFALASGFALTMTACAQSGDDTAAAQANVDSQGYEEIIWEDLMPEGEEERIRQMYAEQLQEMMRTGGNIVEGSAMDTAVQIGTYNVDQTLNGLQIKLPGYTVPFDFSPNAEITEFLLVPYYGACLHAPPPPPNQTVYVKTSTPIRITDLAQAVWVRGTLVTETQETELAGAAYTLILDDLEDYY